MGKRRVRQTRKGKKKGKKATFCGSPKMSKDVVRGDARKKKKKTKRFCKEGVGGVHRTGKSVKQKGIGKTIHPSSESEKGRPVKRTELNHLAARGGTWGKIGQ